MWAALVCAAIAGGVISRYVGFESGSLVYPKPSPLAAALQKTAARMNASLPKMVDAGTRLDNTLVSGVAFIYNYTLIHYNSSELAANDIDTFLATAMLNHYCTADASLVKMGVPVDYNYYGNDAKFIGKVAVTPSQCSHTEPPTGN